MTSFETKCACYVIHHVHHIGWRALAKPLGVDPILVASWLKPSKKGNEIHGEVSKMGTIKFYEKYVEGANND